MEKRELLYTLENKRVYATEEPLILCEEVMGDYAEIRNTMHCFLMQGLSDQEVTVNCLGKTGDTQRAALAYPRGFDAHGNAVVQIYKFHAIHLPYILPKEILLFKEESQ